MESADTNKEEVDIPTEDADNKLDISWKGVFLTALLIVVLIVITTKVIIPAMIPTNHSPASVLQNTIM